MFPVSTNTLLHLVLITTKGFIFMFHYAGKKKIPHAQERDRLLQVWWKRWQLGSRSFHFVLCLELLIVWYSFIFMLLMPDFMLFTHLRNYTDKQTNKQISQLTPFRHSLSKLWSAVFLWLLSSLTDWPHLYLNFGPFWAFEKRWIFVY